MSNPTSSRGSTFNGGTITTPLVVDLSGGDGSQTPLTTILPAGAFAQLFAMYRLTNGADIEMSGDGSLDIYSPLDATTLTVHSRPTVGQVFAAQKSGGANVFETTSDNKIGLYGHAAAAQQTLHSAIATPEQIALALEANGFCGGD